MKWKNLTENKCPKCEKYLMWDELGNLYCITMGCKFLISQSKFRAIVNNQITEDLKENDEEEDIYE